MGKWISINLSQAEDFECLGHSNWTIAAICTNYISQILQIFHFHDGRPILITPERGRLKMIKLNSPNLSERKGFPSRFQAWQERSSMQKQEENSRNQVQAFIESL